MIPSVRGHVGTPFVLKGRAYDFGHSISAIEFSLDDGLHWTSYDTERTVDFRNVDWSMQMTLGEPGVYRMLVRSVNDCGEASPTSSTAIIEIVE